MSIINTGTGGLPSEPFRMAATYLDMGLSVFPCAGDDGKKPCVKWKWLQNKRVGGKLLNEWLRKFSDTNVAIVTGRLSGITVIDVDNPNIALTELFNKHGETPLVAQTPRGGYHLYYRFNGESCSQDVVQKIDVRGEGGYIIAPPSFNRATGEIYHFIEGGIWEIPNLPIMKNNSEIQREYNEGERNNALFLHVVRNAKTCPNLTTLTEIAEAFNQQNLNPPLDDAELQQVVKSVWGYKARGTLASADGQFITLPMQKLKPVMFTHPRAVILYIDLHCCHSGINETFAISPKAYSKRCGWSDSTVYKEIKTLLCYELIKRVYKGGHHPHDPSLYKFL